MNHAAAVALSVGAAMAAPVSASLAFGHPPMSAPRRHHQLRHWPRGERELTATDGCGRLDALPGDLREPVRHAAAPARMAEDCALPGRTRRYGRPQPEPRRLQQGVHRQRVLVDRDR